MGKDDATLSADLSSRERDQEQLRFNKVIARISWAYFALSCLCAIYIPLSIAVSSLAPLDEAILGMASVNLFVYFAAFIGLKHRYSWAPSLVLLLSAFSLLYGAMQMVEPSEGLIDIMGKFVTLAMIAFFMHQILFFCRPEVRLQFQAGGLDLY